MPSTLRFVVLILLITGPAICHPQLQQSEVTVTTYRLESSKSMDDVIQDLEFAIGSHNFRPTSRNHIGQAISDRDQIEFVDARVIHFCNLEFARTLLEISLDYLIFMPCRVVVWENPESVSIEARLVPETLHPTATVTIRKINRILENIVKIAAEPWQDDRPPADSGKRQSRAAAGSG